MKHIYNRIEFRTHVKMSACNSGIFNLSCILCGLKRLFSSECKTCLSVVHGTSTNIYTEIIVISKKKL